MPGVDPPPVSVMLTAELTKLNVDLLSFLFQPCRFPDAGGSKMTCVIPDFVEDEVAIGRSSGSWNATDGPGVAAFVAADDSQRQDVYVGLQFDGYRGYDNVSEEFPGMKFQFPPLPTVTCPSDVIEVDPEKEDAVISIEVCSSRLTSTSSSSSIEVVVVAITIQMLCYLISDTAQLAWLHSRVVSVLDTGAEGPGFKSQSRRCRVTVLGKLFTHIVPLFTKQKNW